MIQLQLFLDNRSAHAVNEKIQGTNRSECHIFKETDYNLQMMKFKSTKDTSRQDLIFFAKANTTQ